MISLNTDNKLVSVKYVDFGFSCMEGTCTSRIIGTPVFNSPEMTRSDIFQIDAKDIDTIELYKSRDMWALGISICELLFGESYTFSYLSSYVLNHVSTNKYQKNEFDENSFYSDINNALLSLELKLKINDTSIDEASINIACNELTNVLHGLLDLDYKNRYLRDIPKIREILTIHNYSNTNGTV